MMAKTKDFEFDTQEKDFFKSEKKVKLGRPKKKEEDKLSHYCAIKMSADEKNWLQEEFEKRKYDYSSFSSFLRSRLLEGYR